MNYALIKGNTVINTVICESDTAAAGLFPDYIVVNICDGMAGVGWSYDGKNFTPPPEPEKTHDEMVAEAESEKQNRLDYATNEIVVWQTKLLMGRKLTANETAQLNVWLDYIDAVIAVDTSTMPDITWPVQPETKAS